MGGKTLTLFGHPFMKHPERRFAPTTVRLPRNAVRFESEQMSAFIGIRNQRGDGLGTLPSREPHLVHGLAKTQRAQRERTYPTFQSEHEGNRWKIIRKVTKAPA